MNIGGFFIPSRNHDINATPVQRFMDNFLEGVEQTVTDKSLDVTDVMNSTAKYNREVWTDDALRELALNALASRGTEQIQHGCWNVAPTAHAMIILGDAKYVMSCLPLSFRFSEDAVRKCRDINGDITKIKHLFATHTDIPGADSEVEGHQAAIDELTRKRNGEGEDPVTVEAILKIKRSTYKTYVAKVGKIDDAAINLGRELAVTLIRSKRSIEAHHLLSDLLANSLSIHGAEHTCTTRTQELLDACKFCSRLVGRSVQGELQHFEAIRYKYGGAYCVIRDGDRRIAAPTDEIYFEVGNIAVCHGLKNAVHLNGKLGEVTSWHEKTGRYDIRFEDEGVKSASVKRGNLRIAHGMIDNGKADALDGQQKRAQNGPDKKGGSQTLTRSTSTEWYCDRKNNGISPMQRLIHWCELSQAQQMDGGLPEEHVAGVATPYSYWGLPPCGGSGKVMLRCNHCRSEDFTWLVDNVELVKVHFDEVSNMGSNLGLYKAMIDELENEILIDTSSTIKDKAGRRKKRNIQRAYPDLADKLPEWVQMAGTL